MIETTITVEKSVFMRNTANIWPDYGYFKQQPCDFGIDKENMPKNPNLYINQGHQSVKDNKKIYYADYFLIGQVNECGNPSENLQDYKCQNREVIMYRPRYDTVTDTFCRLCETLGYEHFLDYGYSKQNSKILHSHYKKRIPSSFSGTFFNRHQIQFESGTLQSTFSNLYFFLPSTTVRVEDINQYVGSVNLSPIDMLEKTFVVEENISFDPLKLDFECPEKEKIAKAVVKMLKKNHRCVNAILVKKADSLLSKKNINEEVEWIDKDKKCLPDNRYKMSY